MAKGDRTETKIRELKAELLGLENRRQNMLKNQAQLRKEWTEERRKLIAAHPHEVNARLQETMTVMREALSEMEAMSAMLDDWCKKS